MITVTCDSCWKNISNDGESKHITVAFKDGLYPKSNPYVLTELHLCMECFNTRRYISFENPLGKKYEEDKKAKEKAESES